MKKVAVIGTGIMGHGIASNFLKNGYRVFVWNRTTTNVKDLVNHGAVATNTPKQTTQEADIVFEVTANDTSSKSVWTGKNGILAGAAPNKILITCATLSTSWVDKLANLCHLKKYNFLDLPMTGGRVGAETGKLILLAGGDEKTLKTIESDLKTISQKVTYFGKSGSGMRFKLLLNMLQAIHIVALGEVLNLAKEVGLDIKVVGDFLAERPGGTTTNLAWRDYQKEPNPINFSIEWITKDLKYTKQLQKGVKLPLLDKTLQKYKKALSQKRGEKDWTTINKI